MDLADKGQFLKFSIELAHVLVLIVCTLKLNYWITECTQLRKENSEREQNENM